MSIYILMYCPVAFELPQQDTRLVEEFVLLRNYFFKDYNAAHRMAESLAKLYPHHAYFVFAACDKYTRSSDVDVEPV